MSQEASGSSCRAVTILTSSKYIGHKYNLNLWHSSYISRVSKVPSHLAQVTRTMNKQDRITVYGGLKVLVDNERSRSRAKLMGADYHILFVFAMLYDVTALACCEFQLQWAPDCPQDPRLLRLVFISQQFTLQGLTSYCMPVQIHYSWHKGPFTAQVKTITIFLSSTITSRNTIADPGSQLGPGNSRSRDWTR